MNNERLISQIRELCQPPQPESKEQFFQFIKDQGLTNKRSAVMSHREFLLGQLPYIEKWTWIMSGVLLLFITWICYQNSGNYPFALTPLLAAGILLETRRSHRWKMAELEHAARFSLRSVILARLFLIGAVDTAGLMIVIAAPALFAQLYEERLTIFWAAAFVLMTCSLAVSLREWTRNMEEPVWN